VLEVSFWGGQRQIVAFCRIFGGRQIATARNLKSDSLSLFYRFFAGFFDQNLGSRLVKFRIYRRGVRVDMF